MAEETGFPSRQLEGLAMGSFLKEFFFSPFSTSGPILLLQISFREVAVGSEQATTIQGKLWGNEVFLGPTAGILGDVVWGECFVSKAWFFLPGYLMVHTFWGAMAFGSCLLCVCHRHVPDTEESRIGLCLVHGERVVCCSGVSRETSVNSGHCDVPNCDDSDQVPEGLLLTGLPSYSVL